MGKLHRLALASTAVGALLLLGGTAAAAPYGYDMHLTLSWDDPDTVGEDSAYVTLYDLPLYIVETDEGGTYIIDSDPIGTPTDPNDPSTWEPYSIPGVADIGWNSEWDSDPLVSNNLSVTNILPFALTIDVTVTGPVVPPLPATLMNGSVGVTLTEVGGATTASATTSGGIDFYRALVDTVEVQDLLDDPYTLSCGLNSCTATDSDDFGIPIMIPGPAVNTNIAIRIRTVLSAGDAIAVTSVFEVIEDAPEPMALGLLGAALAGAFVARRRS